MVLQGTSEPCTLFCFIAIPSFNQIAMMHLHSGAGAALSHHIGHHQSADSCRVCLGKSHLE